MASGLVKFVLNIALVLTLALAATTCGRRGSLEAPPSSSVVTSDGSGEVQEEQPVEDKPFILDALL